MTAPASAAASALAPAVDQAEQQLDDDEVQLGLWSEPQSEAGRAKLVKAGILKPNGNRGLGRPLGSRNKRTEETVRHLLSRYRSPLAIALERIQMHPADLAALLGCTIAEADDKQRLWAAAIGGFLFAKITPDVVDARPVIHMHQYLGSAGDGQALGAQVVVISAEADGPSAITDGGSAACKPEPEPAHEPSTEEGPS